MATACLSAQLLHPGDGCASGRGDLLGHSAPTRGCSRHDTRRRVACFLGLSPHGTDGLQGEMVIHPPDTDSDVRGWLFGVRLFSLMHRLVLGARLMLALPQFYT